jgi:hypothetical protein
MKKIKLLTSNVAFGIISLTSCTDTPKPKMEEALNEVIEAEVNIDTANLALKAELEHYRSETNDKIAIYSKQLEDFKSNAANQKKLANKEYQKKIAALEDKNVKMKKKVNEYLATDRMGWYDFREKCEYDMQCIDKDLYKICNPMMAK